MRVRLVYYQVDEDQEFTFNHDYSADALDAIVTDLLTRVRALGQALGRVAADEPCIVAGLPFPFASYAPVSGYDERRVQDLHRGGQLLCQAPTGIGKTMSVLFPALKAVGKAGRFFTLTARGTTRAAAEMH